MNVFEGLCRLLQFIRHSVEANWQKLQNRPRQAMHEIILAQTIRQSQVQIHQQPPTHTHPTDICT